MKKVYLNTLTPEEIVKRLKAGEVVKRMIDSNEVIYKIIDSIIVKIDREDTNVGRFIYIDKDYDYYFEEEPFEITQCGVYKTRDGRKAYVYKIDEETDDKYPICFILENSESFVATREGRFIAGQEAAFDIVAKWED